jgi:hypothetical protein
MNEVAVSGTCHGEACLVEELDFSGGTEWRVGAPPGLGLPLKMGPGPAGKAALELPIGQA